MDRRRSLKALLGEGAVIVVSVLLALSADAWWANHQESQQSKKQLLALARDFEQMSVRADSSLWTAQAGADAGAVLLNDLMGSNPGSIADSAMSMMKAIMFYEVFSPSTGAYEGLISSGGMELIEDEELKRAMEHFFGGFDDMRVSENMLLQAQLGFLEMEDFSRLVGLHQMLPVFETGAAGTTVARVRSWSQSDALLNGIAQLPLRHRDVIDDYVLIREAIDQIQVILATGE